MEEAARAREDRSGDRGEAVGDERHCAMKGCSRVRGDEAMTELAPLEVGEDDARGDGRARQAETVPRPEQGIYLRRYLTAISDPSDDPQIALAAIEQRSVVWKGPIRRRQ